MTRRSQDITFSSDDQACRTMVLDLGDAAKQPLPPDSEATVVLDLTPAQVHQILTDDSAATKPAKK